VAGNIIVDYLNFGVVYYLIKHERKANVIALFRPHSRLKECILQYLVRLLGFNYQVNKLQFGAVSSNPYSRVFHTTQIMANKLAEPYFKNTFKKTDYFFDYKVRNQLFRLLWRSNSVVEYANCIELFSVDKIYVTNPLNNKFKQKLAEMHNSKLKCQKVRFYNAFGAMNDDGYAYTNNKSLPGVLRLWLFAILSVFKITSYITLRWKKTNNKCDILLFSHDEDTTTGWLNGIKMINSLKTECTVARPNGVIGAGADAFNLHKVYWKNTLKFYIHMLYGIHRFFWSLKISPLMYATLIQSWRDMFLLQCLYLELNVNAVYSNYESDFSQLALAIASDSNDIVSYAAIWSLGSFPSDLVCTSYKFADRSFIWGKWHYELFKASFDKSSGYIIAGYIGDIYMTEMAKNAQSMRAKIKKDFDYIIAFYDTSITKDLFYDEIGAVNMLKSILEIASETNSLVVLKTKKNSIIYDSLKLQYTDRLVFDYERASIVPALASDVVVGVCSSTLVCMAAVYGKPIVLFDPANVVWDKWKFEINNMVDSLCKMEFALRNSLLNTPDKKAEWTSQIDPLADGNAQIRMSNYIDDVNKNHSSGKVATLTLADSKYQQRWGADKVILNTFI